MIRASPCAYYIKALFLQRPQPTVAAITEKLEKQGLDPINSTYLLGVRAKLRPPTPFYPHDRFHTPSNRYLIKERVEAFFHPEETMRGANEILRTPRAKEFTEAMLLSGAPALAIARTLTERLHCPSTEKTVLRYRHFYWNLDLIDSTEQKAILQLRVDVLDDDNDRERQAQHNAVKRASYTDPRKVAAGLPFSPMSALLSQMRMGVLPREINLAEVLGRVRDVGALRAFESLMRGAPDDAQASVLYMNASKTATDMLSGLATPEAAVLDQLNKIQIQSLETSVPSVHELSGGSHTVNVEAEPTAKEE